MRKLRAFATLALLSALIIIIIPMSGVNAQETLILSFDVSSDGTPVTTSLPLEAGREYHIVVYGVFTSSAPPFWYSADAQYYTMDSWATWTQPDGHSFLRIDGGDVVWGMWSNTPYWHTYSIYRIGTGAPITFAIVDWVDGNYGNNDCHFHVYIYEGPPVPPEGETAYAYGGDFATCFLSLGFKPWGWTNGPLGPGEYEFDLWAGAAKCDLDKGTLVGTVTINYDGSTAIVEFTLIDGWLMDYTQVYAGSEMLPRDVHGDPTVSPGMYTSIHYSEGGATTDTHTITGLSGNIYVIAHADVFEA